MLVLILYHLKIVSLYWERHTNQAIDATEPRTLHKTLTIAPQNPKTPMMTSLKIT
jgi:hypothetical protein